jgi:LysM repeat protein
MRHWKRLFYYLAINVLVSACTVVAVLAIWDRVRPGALPTGEAPQAAQATSTAVAANPQTTPGTPAATRIGGTPENETPISPSEILSEEEQGGAGGQEYQVQAGDTLGSIAVEFDVSVAEIIAANDLADPDTLEVGQVIIIPGAEGDSEPTEAPAEEEPTATNPPAAGGTPTATSAVEPPPASGEAKVLIDSVFGAGDLASERVFLIRTGPGELNLEGWQLETEDGQTFTFPQLTLFEAGAVNIYTKSGQSLAIALYWGLDQAVWASGDTVTLLDQSGDVHDTYTIP